MINKELAEDRGLSEETIKKIEELHHQRYTIFKVSEEMADDDSQQKLFSDWMNIERELQDLWGFDRDDNMIKFWTFPACSCPQMDNNDAYPYGYYVYSGACVIHGEKVKGNKDD